MKNWNKSNIPSDLNNKTYIITGTSSGIGTVLAYELAKRGAKVIAGNRNVDKAKQALDKVKTKTEDLSSLLILPLDISSLQSVRNFSKIIEKDNAITHIDGLLLNAGIMALPERQVTIDGYELQMATNVLGHHLLTSLLLPKIKLAPRAVIVSTTSSASSTVNSTRIWDDLNAENKYDPWEVYGVSKIAAVQFRDGLLELIKKAKLENQIFLLSTHPGLTATPLFDVSKGIFATVFRSIRSSFMMDVNKGALSTLRATIDETLPNGSFIGPKGLTGMSGYPKPIKIYNPKLSLDPNLRKKMWNYCDKVTGANWSF
ncbi:SDR family NAD(P)-dependent oxidoreductase [Paucihalobacter sp.]|uniref:SDR family NAD(P)-dependent oxidoreductase n=1 Tax=Paucihalobacter sp. TaxID=2850405 RepID=UPI003D161C8F